MFYEEKIIDGVLHWRGIPGGTWKQFTKEELTKRIEEHQIFIKKLHSKYPDLDLIDL
jgi:hypothetical protein